MHKFEKYLEVYLTGSAESESDQKKSFYELIKKFRFENAP